MPKYPFLSDEWVVEAQRIYAEVEASGGLAGASFSPVRVNLVITDAPFSDRPIDAHVDTSSGGVTISTGHLPSPDVTVSMGYGTARALFVAGDVPTVMQAVLDGSGSTGISASSWTPAAASGPRHRPAGRRRPSPASGVPGVPAKASVVPPGARQVPRTTVAMAGLSRSSAYRGCRHSPWPRA